MRRFSFLVLPMGDVLRGNVQTHAAYAGSRPRFDTRKSFASSIAHYRLKHQQRTRGALHPSVCHRSSQGKSMFPKPGGGRAHAPTDGPYAEACPSIDSNTIGMHSLLEVTQLQQPRR